MAQEVFRFVVLSEVKSQSDDTLKKHLVISSENSTLVNELKNLPARTTRTDAEKFLADYATPEKIIRNTSVNNEKVNEIREFLFTGKHSEVLQKKSDIKIMMPRLSVEKKRVTDSTVFFSFGMEPAPKGIIRLFKTFVIMEKISTETISTEAEIVAELNKEVIISPEIAHIYHILKNDEEQPEKKPAKKPSVMEVRLKKALQLNKALKELESLDTSKFQALKTTDPSSRRRKLKDTAVDALTEETKMIYKSFTRQSDGINEDFDHLLFNVRDQLNLTTGAMPVAGIKTVAILSGQKIEVPNIMDTYPDLRRPVSKHGLYVKVYGLADYEVMRQIWDTYEAGEIAHIENVMHGETKSRIHTRTDETEIIEETFSETTETTERELETTDRFELQNEVSKVNNEKGSINGKVQFNYSTPVIDFKSSVEGQYSDETTTKSAFSTSFAQETTERALNEIHKTVRESRKTRSVHKIVERNKHKLAGIKPDGKHTVGIYRWVDKVYKGWVENVGRRMVLEFNIPEPAAFYIFSKIQQSNSVDVPLEPMANIMDMEQESFIPEKKLSPGDITAENYLEFVKVYKVQGAEAPPSLFLTTSVDIADEIMDEQVAIRSINKNLSVPEGYIPLTIAGHLYGNFTQPSIGKSLFVSEDKADEFNWRNEYKRVTVSVNAEDVGVITTVSFADTNSENEYEQKQTSQEHYTFQGTFVDKLISDYSSPDAYVRDFETQTRIYTNRKEGMNNISLSLQARGMRLLNGTIKVTHVRTDEMFMTWQIKTYEKIMAAYYAMKSAADEKLAQESIRQGIRITGQNPAINKEIAGTEIKKHCIDFMYQDRFRGAKDSLNYNDEESSLYPGYEYGDWPKGMKTYPEYDYKQSFKNGRIIEFFEQAFEWHNMMYHLYPYFWSQKDRWPAKMNFNDPDPLFNQFLNAGACRVVLPVRPGFERAMGNFLYTGNLWDSSDPSPLAGLEYHEVDMFLSVLEQLQDEIKKNNSECPPEGTETFPIRIPTSLVYLDQNDTLPFINTTCAPKTEE